MHFDSDLLMLSVVAVLGSVTSVAVIAWHVRAGRSITLFATYIAILLLEFGGGLIQSALGEHSLTLADCVRPLIVRLASLGPFCAAYVAISLMLPWRSGPSAARDISRELHERFNRSASVRLWVMFGILSLIAIYPLYVKVRIAGGLSAFFDVAYLMRFGTHGEAGAENMMIVAASLLASPLSAVIALLTMATATAKSVSLRSWVGLGVAISFGVVTAAVHGRRVGVAISVLVPLLAWHMQRPIELRTLVRIGCCLLLVALALNWLHYHRYTETADWDQKSVYETSMMLLTPHQHLETLSEVLNGADRLQLLGAAQYGLSALTLVPRSLWLEKPSPDCLGTLGVQGWAGLNILTQLAITDVGEAIACMGYAGIAIIAIWGFLYCILDFLMYYSAVGRAVVVGVCITRVFVDQGMGVSALSNSMVTASLAALLIRVAVPPLERRRVSPSRSASRVQGLGSWSSD